MAGTMTAAQTRNSRTRIKVAFMCMSSSKEHVWEEDSKVF